MEKLNWRKLDNSAKIFPLISGKKFSSVFRISAVLNAFIDQDILKEAVKLSLIKFESFKVRIHKGFFWYYFETNLKDIIIEREDSYPCKYIDYKQNHGYLFRVTYFNNKINLEMFHSLTDGNTAIKFLKEIVYNYLDLRKYNTKINRTSAIDIIDSNKYIEDSYIKNSKKDDIIKNYSSKAYILKGEKLPLYSIAVEHIYINIESLKYVTKEKNVTVSQFLTALIIKAIYENKSKFEKINKAITIFIPVDLKKYFKSATYSNFFSKITILFKPSGKTDVDFDYILKNVKEQFEQKLNVDNMKNSISEDVKFGTNPFIRIIPLFLKKATIKLGYIEAAKYNTTTFSNLGKIEVDEKYKKDIDSFLFLLGPGKSEKVKFTACSYDEDLVFTFTSILKSNNVEKKILEILKQQKIKFKIESNGVYDEFISEDTKY